MKEHSSQTQLISRVGTAVLSVLSSFWMNGLVALSVPEDAALAG